MPKLRRKTELSFTERNELGCRNYHKDGQCIAPIHVNPLYHA